MKIDLGCGSNKANGHVGIDITKVGTQADIVHDLNIYPYPFENESVEEIFCSHFIEHVDDLILFMNECWRILKKGGEITFIAPYYTSYRAWADPTHKRSISEATFFYYDQEWRERNKLLHYPIHTDFKILDFSYHYHPDFKGKTDEEIKYAANHYWNVYEDIKTKLKKPL